MSDKLSDGTLDGLINLLKAGAGCNPHYALLALQELQALRAQQQAAGWRVKKLAWSEITAPREDAPREPTGEFEALCVFGAYSVTIDADEDVAASPFCVWSPEDNLGHFASADEAKAAAQSDYAARINSAIAPAPVPDGYVMVPVEPTAAMIEAGVLDTKADVSFFDVEETYRAMLAARPISASGRDGE